MQRFNPFEKLSDLYDSIVEWESDPLIKPDNQNKYLFSDGKTYYEELCKILKLLSTFKTAFTQIYDNIDELEEQIGGEVTEEELQQAISNLQAVLEAELSSVQADLQTDINSLNTRLTSSESNITALQLLTTTHTSDINTINTAINSIQASLLTKIGEAPEDGKTYGRKNGTWTEVTGGGGGGTSDYDALDNKPQINGNILTGNKTGTQLGLVDSSTLSSYVSKSEAPGYDDILTETVAQTLYQTIQAMSNYLLKSEAPGYADILTQSLASTTYQPISGMSDYLTKSEAQTTYQTISAMSSYLTTLDAQATYQTLSDMANYLTTASAQSTYTPLTNSVVASALLQVLASASGVNLIGKASSSVPVTSYREDYTLNLHYLSTQGYLYNSSGTSTFEDKIYFSDEFSEEASDGTLPTRISLSRKILSGTSDPTSTQGSDGDIYIKYSAS